MKTHDISESINHIFLAARDVIELGVKPEHVAAAMFGQATYLFKEQGY